MNEYFTLMVRKELFNFSYVTKVKKGSFTDIIYLYVYRKNTVKPRSDALADLLA